MLASMTSGYMPAQSYSGMCKFMPYHPTMSVSGRKMAVMTVNIFMMLFRLMSTSA